MKAEWKEITCGDVPTHAVGLRASLNPKGHIVINKFTHEKMGAPGAVHLLYDAVNNRIGLKPTSRAMRNAFRIWTWGNRKDRRIVHALKLMREVGITINQTVEFPTLEIDQDGILIIDLRAAQASKKSLGLRRSWEKRMAEEGRNTISIK